MGFLLFTIKEIVQETPDTRSFVLEPHDRDGFSYKAGQFLTIVRGEGDREIRRSFSFSSHPSDQYPRITLKRIANGEISRWLFDHVKVGDEIRTIEASGLFVYPTDVSNYDTVLFMAAGSGITPILSLIREALSRNDNKRLLLVYSNRSEQYSILLGEINELVRTSGGRLSLINFFSNSFNLNRARLGRLALEEVLKNNMRTPARTLFFLCGPHVYMQNISITLLTEGVPEDNIRREIFFNPEPPVVDIPSDKDMHTVKVLYEGKQYTFNVQFPKTILQTAKAQGVMLPYSCEAGRCGTCAATCVSGEIWMLRNEVLLDKEMAKGRVLTCTGFAVGGDAELVIE